jgi:TatD DNase family protein
VVDSHCHLADAAFDEDRTAVIARARQAGLTGALCILAADDPTETERAAPLAKAWGGIRFGMGVHPHTSGGFAGRVDEAAAVVRDALRASPEARAVGEIGLEYHYDFAPRAVQRDVFRVQIRLAREMKLPIVIHTREAEEDTLAILREESTGSLSGVLHCFTGTPHLAEEALALGMHVSFAGIVTFPKAANLREIAAVVPADRLLCETDSPYLAPPPHRGKRNEPAWVVPLAEGHAPPPGEDLEEHPKQKHLKLQNLFRP